MCVGEHTRVHTRMWEQDQTTSPSTALWKTVFSESGSLLNLEFGTQKPIWLVPLGSLGIPYLCLHWDHKWATPICWLFLWMLGVQTLVIIHVQ